ncbi:hypothetical protein NQ318_022671 [Aromia moschata]|uniref:Uncharacterized protein n=1 Tax=Aromia moschata TaxID=1265417 RepID=A0AAV8YMT5_9CUCU|nr:hypothetical protein NQ318_022671 [Aromia moschata]
MKMFKLFVWFILFWVGSNGNEYKNPIALSAPDPWMQYYNGYYYLVATTWTNEIGIRKASTLGGLVDVENTIVYTFDGHTAWAPEIHLIDDRWYLLYCSCAPNTENYACHRNHVAQSATDDPMGPYTFLADLDEPSDQTMELDPSYIFINGQLYLLGSYIGDTQNLYIRPMANPYTPTAAKSFLAAPTYDWEIEGGTTNEGPEPLYGRDGKIFVVYSASSCNTPNYKLGLMQFTGTDPLNSTHWYKYPDPVFQRSDENHVYGPGHNGFFRSPDGTEDWIVYHGNEKDTEGCGMGGHPERRNTPGLPMAYLFSVYQKLLTLRIQHHLENRD